MLLLTISAAHAFCGAYVGSAGATLENASSVVVFAQDAGKTTMTIVPDVQGDAADFGVIVPVPAGMDASAITDGDADAVDLLDLYSVPRGVAYTCDTLWSASPSGGSGCASPLTREEAAPTTSVGGEVDSEVAVHATFTSGSYEMAIVSSDDPTGLQNWLGAQGYVVPDGGQALLDQYVESGSWFLTARVALTSTPTERTSLSPIRVAYSGETWSVPIRLGTMSGGEEQEVVILGVADDEMGIANYPELAVDTECMWKGDDLDAAYEDQLEDARVEAGGAGWIREYSWDLSSHCDPCTTEQSIDADTLAAVGYSGNTAHLTRLRLRYDPRAVTQDVSLYATGRTGVTDQVRFVRYAEELEDWFPVCDEGWAENPGTCPDVQGSGCDTPLVPASGAATLLALALLRRRR
jgi:hypothetical protein